MHETFLGFGRMHENKIFFVFFLNLIFLKFLIFFKKNILEKTEYIYIGFVSYGVSLQLNIMQNY
jgi:hypothetical protein